MSLPLFLVDTLPSGASFELGGPEGRHAAAVQRLQPGEELLLGDGRGGMARAVVLSASKAALTVSIVDTGFEAAPVPKIIVAQGIPKGDRGELAVQAMTETGVDEIIPWAAGRSVTVWKGDRGMKSREKWISTAREASKQSRRAWIPAIAGNPDLSTKQLAGRLAPVTFVLHEEAKDRLAVVDLPAGADSLMLIIGPEGGIDDNEIALLSDRGAIPARLGDNILRTSTAGVAALAVLNTRLSRW